VELGHRSLCLIHERHCYIRKVEKAGGKLENVEFDRIPGVKDPQGREPRRNIGKSVQRAGAVEGRIVSGFRPSLSALEPGSS